MAADRSRLAAALAYRQAEEERRRRMMESVPVPGAELPTPVPSQNLRRDLENLSIGIGEGLTNQLEGVKGIVTDPIGAARGAYEGVKAVVRDPSIIADALRYTAQKVGSGPLGAGEVIGEMIGPRKGGPVMQELDVYHGTPHRFPATEANPLGEFDASKIGTGEGAQAYGHGVYLAESPAVAQGYRDALSKNVTVDGAKLQSHPSDSPLAQAHNMTVRNIQNGMTPDAAIAATQKYWIDAANEMSAFTKNHPELADRIAKEALGNRQIAEAAATLKPESFYRDPGALYKADLPDEMIDRMLDWDKPLSEQPEFVQKAWADWRNSPQAQKLVKQMGSRGFSAQDLEKTFGNPTGAAMHKWIYEGFGSSKGGEMPKVAQFLKDKGLVGVKYQDAGSRGQGGSGTRNFVVFPGEEKKVRILERDGQKAPRQKIAQALEAAPRKLETAFDAPEVKPGDIVDGLKVRPEVANVGSIKASLDNYTVLPGIRSVSIADFGEAGPLTGNVDKLDRRTRNLADQITESKEITPLIVVYSGTQNYILEGSHRIDALDALGKKRIPVIAVIDEDDPPKFMRQKR